MREKIIFILIISLIILVVGKANATLVLEIHSDTYHGDTAFIDSSPSSHTIINSSGAVYHSTTTKVFGNSSIYFDGTHNNFLFVPTGNDWNLSENDFTIDFRINFQVLGSHEGFNHDPIITTTPWSAAGGWQIYYDADDRALDVWESDTGSHKTSWEATVDQWYHLTLTKQDGLMRWYVDEQFIGYVPAGAVMDNDGNPLAIGNFCTDWHPCNPHFYFDEISISKSTPIPVPSTCLLFLFGMVGMLGIKKRGL